MGARLPAKLLQTGTTPSSVGTANSVGSGNDVAFANHAHDHGSQALGTGTQHAEATTSVAGFESAADKTKLDGIAVGADISGFKASCRLATTTSVTNPTSGAPLSVDGSNVAAGDRVLLCTGGPSGLNGIYDVVTPGSGSNGVWARSADADTAAEFFQGLAVFVRSGTANAGSTYTLSFTAPLTLGTTGLLFTKGIGLTSITPTNVGTASVGTSALVSRSDHVHGHGAQAADGTMHAAATTAVSGFMAALDKKNVDRLTAPSVPVYGATITLDVAAAANHHIGLLTGDVVLSFSNAAAGLSGEIYVKQDSTGGRSVAFVAPSPYVLITDNDAALIPSTAPYTTTLYTYSFLTIGSFSLLRVSKKQLSLLHAYRGVLGSSLVALWHQSSGFVFSSGVNISTWTDVVGNNLMGLGSGTAAPTYAADGSNFLGKSVVQGVPGGKVLQNGSMPGLVAAGSRPYVFQIARYKTTTGSYPYLIRMGVADDLVIYAPTFTGAPYLQLKPSSGNINFPTAVSTGLTAQHRDEIWLDGTNAHFTRDGVDQTYAASGTMGAIESIACGNAVGDTSHFLIGICSSVPSAAQRTALQAIMTADAG
jgi:hypothetical protein